MKLVIEIPEWQYKEIIQSPNLCFEKFRGLLKAIKNGTPLPKGHWEKTDQKYSDDWHCSRCGAIVEADEQNRHNWNYCYHCGADMREK